MGERKMDAEKIKLRKEYVTQTDTFKNSPNFYPSFSKFLESKNEDGRKMKYVGSPMFNEVLKGKTTKKEKTIKKIKTLKAKKVEQEVIKGKPNVSNKAKAQTRINEIDAELSKLTTDMTKVEEEIN